MRSCAGRGATRQGGANFEASLWAKRRFSDADGKNDDDFTAALEKATLLVIEYVS